MPDNADVWVVERFSDYDGYIVGLYHDLNDALERVKRGTPEVDLAERTPGFWVGTALGLIRYEITSQRVN
jgi:hypothetical protein